MSKRRLALWAASVFAVSFTTSVFIGGSPAVGDSSPCGEKGRQCTSGSCNCYIDCPGSGELCFGKWYCRLDSATWTFEWKCEPICLPAPGDECEPNR
jgi:hypothetical protein